MRAEAQQFSKIALQEQATSSFGNKQRGLNKDQSALSLMLSPQNKEAGGVATLDLGSIEVLTKIQKATQDANELMRAKYLRDVWKFSDLHKEDEAPSYIHRIKGHEIKHI